MKLKKDFPVGQKVKGYGLLNEYGEFEFVPEQTGSRKGQTKVIKSGEDYTLSSTKNSVIVHINIKKDRSLAMIKRLTIILSQLITDLRDYAI